MVIWGFTLLGWLIGCLNTLDRSVGDEDVQLPKSTLVCISCPDLHSILFKTVRPLAKVSSVHKSWLRTIWLTRGPWSPSGRPTVT